MGSLWRQVCMNQSGYWPQAGVRRRDVPELSFVGEILSLLRISSDKSALPWPFTTRGSSLDIDPAHVLRDLVGLKRRLPLVSWTLEPWFACRQIRLHLSGCRLFDRDVVGAKAQTRLDRNRC